MENIQQSYNLNQPANAIKIDYKVVLHHNHVLKNNLVIESGEKYGILQFMSNSRGKPRYTHRSQKPRL